jgi:comEA protein
MKKWFSVVVMVVFLVGTAGISFSADQQAPAQPAPPAAQQQQAQPQPAPAPAVQQPAPAQPAPPAAPPAAAPAAPAAPKEMKKEEKAAAPAKVTKKAKAAETAAPVNINTATEKELQKLPGVGKVLSKRIVEYRTKNGPFSAPEDLMKVKGITKKKFEALKSRITVQ